MYTEIVTSVLCFTRKEGLWMEQLDQGKGKEIQMGGGSNFKQHELHL